MAKGRYKHVCSSYLVLIKDNKILLQRRQNTGYEDGNYGLPAGHVERAESFTQAVAREVKEEIGIDLEPEDAKVLHIMHRYSVPGVENQQERVDVFFTAEKWEGNIKNKEPEKCSELAWFDLDNLPANTIPYIKQVIQNIQNKIFYSEFGWEKLNK